MGKLIKYEFRNNRKSLFQFFFIIGIASLVMQLGLTGLIKINESYIYGRDGYKIIGTLSNIFFFGSGFIIFVSVILFYISLANILKKDIYQDRGYITFSLPRSGYQIIGSKVIVAFVWAIVLPLIAILWNFVIGYILNVFIAQTATYEIVSNLISDFIEVLRYAFQNMKFTHYLVYFLNTIVSFVFAMLVMYASVIADYKIGRRKEDSSRWILFFIIFFIIWGYISITLFGTIDYEYSMLVGQVEVLELVDAYTRQVIINTIINTLVSILLFIYIGYNLENKIEK